MEDDTDLFASMDGLDAFGDSEDDVKEYAGNDAHDDEAEDKKRGNTGAASHKTNTESYLFGATQDGTFTSETKAKKKKKVKLKAGDLSDREFDAQQLERAKAELLENSIFGSFDENYGNSASEQVKAEDELVSQVTNLEGGQSTGVKHERSQFVAQQPRKKEGEEKEPQQNESATELERRKSIEAEKRRKEAEEQVAAEERDREERLRRESSLDSDGKLRLGENVVVSELFTKVLKPHQIRGVRFMWNHVINDKGCILADYMGLGKTLQVITLIHTFMHHFKHEDDTDRPVTVLVLAPASVVRNWNSEVAKWLDDGTEEGDDGMQRLNLKVLDSRVANNFHQRLLFLENWQQEGGVIVMGYELFRSLALLGSAASSSYERVMHAKFLMEESRNSPSYEMRKQDYENLWEEFEDNHGDELRASELVASKPGPSLVIVDEGHRLRKMKSQLVKAVKKIQTKRRIILTGYPLQNHLDEYYCMVDFARPGHLGPPDTFKNRFVIPIDNGIASDSSQRDVALARTRTYLLNELLRSIVLRRDSSHLAKELPPKYEWVVRCRLSEIQAQLYRGFVRNKVELAEKEQSSKNGGIIAAYHHSLSIVNHPDILCLKLQKLEKLEAEQKRTQMYKSDHTTNGSGNGSGSRTYQTGGYQEPRPINPFGYDPNDLSLIRTMHEHQQQRQTSNGGFPTDVPNDGRITTLEQNVPVVQGRLQWMMDFRQLENASGGVKAVVLCNVPLRTALQYNQSSPFLEVYDELVEVEGVRVGGDIERAISTIKTLASSLQNSGSIKLLFRRHEKRSQFYHQCVQAFSSDSSANSYASNGNGNGVSNGHTNGEEVGENEGEASEDDDDDDVVEVTGGMNTSDGHLMKWAVPLMTDYVLGAKLSHSGKMQVLFAILRHSRKLGEKVLVFSQSVMSLNIIQSIINQHNKRVDRYNQVKGGSDDEGYEFSASEDEMYHTNNKRRADNGKAKTSKSGNGKAKVLKKTKKKTDDPFDDGWEDESIGLIESDEESEIDPEEYRNIKEGDDKCPYVNGVKCGYMRLDGSTPQTERIRLIKEFNDADVSDVSVFLLSTRAAGEGLNLQTANRVVMFDACWNPCLDHEAMCRSYRFGQRKPVFVYRLVAAGTMERTIYDQQTRKESLTHRVIDARATKRLITKQDLRDFFNLRLFNQLQREKCKTPKLTLRRKSEKSKHNKKTKRKNANRLVRNKRKINRSGPGRSRHKRSRHDSLGESFDSDDDVEDLSLENNDEDEDYVDGESEYEEEEEDIIGDSDVNSDDDDDEGEEADDASDEDDMDYEIEFEQDEESLANESIQERRQRKALKRDIVLCHVLHTNGELITNFRLEDLLINEDDSERCTAEEKQQAMKEHMRFKQLEEFYIKQGLTASAAAMRATFDLQREMHQQQGFQQGQEQQQIQQLSQQKQIDLQTTMQAQNRQLENIAHTSTLPKHSTPFVERPIFTGLRVFVLRRKMTDAEAQGVIRVCNENGAMVLREPHASVTHIISTWPLPNLQSWLARLRQNPSFENFSPQFKTPQWVTQCLITRQLDPGFNPPAAPPPPGPPPPSAVARALQATQKDVHADLPGATNSGAHVPVKGASMPGQNPVDDGDTENSINANASGSASEPIALDLE